ncbi:MAG: HEAT repeat domain-containing protein [Acidobacteria bacterium]|nr:HEAT repeat domain-containing protein [Acidobacteriota bacterium]
MTQPFVLSTAGVYDLVVTVLWTVSIVFLFLLLIIVVNKAWRESREGFAARRRTEMEPALFRYVMGTEPVEKFLPSGVTRRDWLVIEKIFFDLLRVARGNVNTRAREAFERLGMVDHYTKQLDSRRWWLRAEAAEKLGLMASEKPTRRLIEVMSDPMPEVRIRAAQALGGIGTPESLRPLVGALRDAGRWSAIRVGGMLIAAGDDAVDVLLEEFRNLPDAARISAIDIFGRIKSLRASRLLLDLLKDPVADLRARAAYALGMIGDPTNAGALAACLNDREWSVRAMAAKALGRLRETDSVPALSAALSDAQWWVRANAAEALRGKGGAGQDALLHVLDSDDPYAAQQSVQMLQESGVLDTFVGMLVSTAPGEQTRALGIMAKLVKLRRTDLLTEVARDHPDRMVRQRLAALLGLPAPVA